MKISLLDCTLRDGGYVNNWMFGLPEIVGIVSALEKANTNIIELGFLRDTQPNINSTSFAKMEDINSILQKKKDVIYSAMIEAFNPYPLGKLSKRNDDGVDLIRVCIWKKNIVEHIQYCKEVAQKGYLLSIQPSRVEQYNDEEFIDMLKRCNDLNPYSVYVVDTWGTQSAEQIEHYFELADQYLSSSIRIGYHGHNNKYQALSCAQKVLQMNVKHDLCIDSSIMGMGRGAGNLNTEVIMEYINGSIGSAYDTKQIVNAFNEYLQRIYNENHWGYSLYYFLSATYRTNPNFATYFEQKEYSLECFEEFLSILSEQEKIVFNASFVEKKLRIMQGDQL